MILKKGNKMNYQIVYQKDERSTAKVIALFKNYEDAELFLASWNAVHAGKGAIYLDDYRGE